MNYNETQNEDGARSSSEKKEAVSSPFKEMEKLIPNVTIVNSEKPSPSENNSEIKSPSEEKFSGLKRHLSDFSAVRSPPTKRRLVFESPIQQQPLELKVHKSEQETGHGLQGSNSIADQLSLKHNLGKPVFFDRTNYMQIDFLNF